MHKEFVTGGGNKTHTCRIFLLGKVNRLQEKYQNTLGHKCFLWSPLLCSSFSGRRGIGRICPQHERREENVPSSGRNVCGNRLQCIAKAAQRYELKMPP
jgi:hypothetical protein